MSIIDRLFARVPVFMSEVEVSESVKKVLDNADLLRHEIHDAIAKNTLEEHMRNTGVFRVSTRRQA
jgi:hypothetical protein